MRAGVVVKVLVCAAAIFNMAVVVKVLFIDVLAAVEIIVMVGIIVITLKFAVSVSCFVYVESDMTVADVVFDVLTGIGIEVLADVSTNASAGVMPALEFAVLTP